MIYFKCTYCDKPIQSIAVVVDATHIYHKECERKQSLEIKWAKAFDEGSFLHGLKGFKRDDTLVPEYMKCCKSTMINEK